MKNQDTSNLRIFVGFFVVVESGILGVFLKWCLWICFPGCLAVWMFIMYVSKNQTFFQQCIHNSEAGMCQMRMIMSSFITSSSISPDPTIFWNIFIAAVIYSMQKVLSCTNTESVMCPAVNIQMRQSIIHQHRKHDVSWSKHTNEAETLPQIPVSAFSQGLVVLRSLTLKSSSLWHCFDF